MTELLNELNACQEAKQWAEGRTLSQAYRQAGYYIGILVNVAKKMSQNRFCAILTIPERQGGQ